VKFSAKPEMVGPTDSQIFFSSSYRQRGFVILVVSRFHLASTTGRWQGLRIEIVKAWERYTLDPSVSEPPGDTHTHPHPANVSMCKKYHWASDHTHPAEQSLMAYYGKCLLMTISKLNIYCTADL
jgi:hypothetical protein